MRKTKGRISCQARCFACHISYSFGRPKNIAIFSSMQLWCTVIIINFYFLVHSFNLSPYPYHYPEQYPATNPKKKCRQSLVKEVQAILSSPILNQPCDSFVDPTDQCTIQTIYFLVIITSQKLCSVWYKTGQGSLLFSKIEFVIKSDIRGRNFLWRGHVYFL